MRDFFHIILPLLEVNLFGDAPHHAKDTILYTPFALTKQVAIGIKYSTQKDIYRSPDTYFRQRLVYVPEDIFYILNSN